jgi:hypothetical protein
MRPHGSAANGLNWDDGNIPYDKLLRVLTAAVTGYAHSVAELKNANFLEIDSSYVS